MDPKSSDRTKRVEEIFQSAMDHSLDGRAVYLDEVCNGDAQLRREVESMISSYERAGSFMDKPAIEVDAHILARPSGNLTPGELVDAYKIVRLLGAGGMGEVFVAEDTRLGRRVALKLLPTHFSADSDRVRRFQQEARAASALNHPNVLAVYDVGVHHDLPYLVSELLEGETVREKLKGDTLSQRKVLEYAQQIAAGLSAAHERGIIHRDIKPENIFVTRDGRVKILDFGLAKLAQSSATAVGSDNDHEAATRVAIKTEPNIVMGTAGYMSPEQVRGHKVDHRSDIFSFGAVLYEMLSGKRAFTGQSSVETLNAILKEDPHELSKSSLNISPALERVVRHCLEKNPEERFQSARDLAFALEALTVTTSGAQLDADSLTRTDVSTRWLTHVPWLVAGVAVLVLILLLALLYFRRAPSAIEARSVRFFLNAPPETNIAQGIPMVSPDGQRVIFRAQDLGGNTRLWVRALDALEAHPLAGTEEAVAGFFWSADSRYVAFVSGGKLKKMEATGGPAQVLADAPEPGGGTWGEAGVIVFSPNLGPLYRVAATGGPALPVTRLDNSRGEVVHVAPRFLPDGHHFLYLALSGKAETRAIYVGSLDSPESKVLLTGAEASSAYAPPGYLLFMRGTTLMAQAFNLERFELTGEPQPIIQNVVVATAYRLAGFSVSNNGVLVYRSNTFANTQLTWFDRAGSPLGTVGPTINQFNPALSSDGRRVAITRMDPNTNTRDIWITDLTRGTETRLTSDPANDSHPVWSPDGIRIAFSSQREISKGLAAIFQKPSSGASNEELLFQMDLPIVPLDWSADGNYILCGTSNDPKTRYDLWVLPLFGDRKLTPLLHTEFSEIQGQFSPNGKWVAYTSDESGRPEIYVQSFPPRGDKWPISTAGGTQPQWRRDGKELFYIAPDLKLMAVNLQAYENRFEAGLPRPLFNLHMPSIDLQGGVRNLYVVSGDGQRFLVDNVVEKSTPSPLTVVLNWTADLKH